MKRKLIVCLLSAMLMLTANVGMAFAHEDTNTQDNSKTEQKQKEKQDSSEDDQDATDKILIVGAIMAVGAIWVTIRKHNDK